uniref:Uncharacterized protein n=1 Tax=Labrus bergylta TaxID=56723 RepID=A0A3Q3M5V8_9LABR
MTCSSLYKVANIISILNIIPILDNFQEDNHLCLSLPTTPQLSQSVISTSSLPRQPFSIKRSGQPDNPSKVKIYQYSKDDCLLISDGDEFDFVTLERWEEQYNYHCKLMSIPFFALFKKWKPFYLWRTKVRARKIHLARESLQTNLFIYFSLALIDIRKMCCQISDTGLFHVEKNHTYSLSEFQGIQFKQLQEVQFHIYTNVCSLYIHIVYLCVPPQNIYVCVCVCVCIYIYMSKICILSTLSFCVSHLSSFIRLVDYLVINTLHVLMVNAVTKLLSVVREKVHQTPSHAIIQSWSQQYEAKTETVEEEMDKKCFKSETPGAQSMFVTHLMLDTNALTYKPSEENFQKTLAEVIGLFESTVMSVNTLSADPDFYAFTKPQADKVVKKKLLKRPGAVFTKPSKC